MSRVFVCLSVLFVLSIAIRFGDCENNTTQPECNGNIEPGSSKTHISFIEKTLKLAADRLNKTEEFKGPVGKIFDKAKQYAPQVILPGTRWCGDGDIARNKDDLGPFKDTDACCRAHDNCQSNLLAGEEAVNIINDGIFTRSSCTCDFAFYNCLKNVSSPISIPIGITYFNTLRQQCFQCICPTEDCKLEDGTECKGHCKKYKWVDSPKFISIFGK